MMRPLHKNPLILYFCFADYDEVQLSILSFNAFILHEVPNEVPDVICYDFTHSAVFNIQLLATQYPCDRNVS